MVIKNSKLKNMKKYYIGTIVVTIVILAVGYFFAPAMFHDILSVVCGIWIGYVASCVHRWYYAKKLK